MPRTTAVAAAVDAMRCCPHRSGPPAPAVAPVGQTHLLPSRVKISLSVNENGNYFGTEEYGCSLCSSTCCRPTEARWDSSTPVQSSMPRRGGRPCSADLICVQRTPLLPPSHKLLNFFGHGNQDAWKITIIPSWMSAYSAGLPFVILLRQMMDHVATGTF